MPPTTSSPATRPGGRSARVRAAVHRAVEELVSEGGMEAVSVPAVAERAGVHATTIYRRWAGVGELLADVAVHRFSGDLVVPATGSLRGDLETWTASIAADLSDPESLAVMRAAIGAGGEEGACGCVADRRAQLEAMLAAERDRGGEAPGADLATDALLAPLYYRALFTPDRPLDADVARELVARLLG